MIEVASRDTSDEHRFGLGDMLNLRTRSAAKAGTGTGEKHHRLAAGDDGGQQAFWTIGHQDEVNVPRRLLQRLQKSVGGLGC